MQRWISGDQGTFRPCHLLASAHPKTHQTQRLGQVLASRLIAAPTDAWFLGSSVFELGLIELSWVLTVLIHHIQRNSGRFSGILWHFHDPNLTSQNFTAWRAASKALRCRGSPRGAAPRSCCSARRMGRSFDLRFRRDADVSRLLAANYTNTFNHLYIYINIYIYLFIYIVPCFPPDVSLWLLISPLMFRNPGLPSRRINGWFQCQARAAKGIEP